MELWSVVLNMLFFSNFAYFAMLSTLGSRFLYVPVGGGALKKFLCSSNHVSIKTSSKKAKMGAMLMNKNGKPAPLLATVKMRLKTFLKEDRRG